MNRERVGTNDQKPSFLLKQRFKKISKILIECRATHLDKTETGQ